MKMSWASRIWVLLAWACLLVDFLGAKLWAQVPTTSHQLILGLAGDWNSSHVVLQRFERVGKGWKPVGSEVKGRVGSAGLVWGHGIHPNPPNAKLKKEGDRRAPAGVFRLGNAYGYDREIRRKSQLVYRQVTPADLWVEDPDSPWYNRHLVLKHGAPKTAWEKKQQMKLNDPPHSLKLFIRHNADAKVIPHGGSSIFFHIWREGGKRATSGCTTMSESNLREWLTWVDPSLDPVYVLLPQTEYQQLKRAWMLP